MVGLEAHRQGEAKEDPMTMEDVLDILTVGTLWLASITLALSLGSSVRLWWHKRKALRAIERIAAEAKQARSGFPSKDPP